MTAPSLSPAWRGRLVLTLKLTVVAGALAWLVGTGRLTLADMLTPLGHPLWAALGALLTLAPFFITFARLRQVLAATGVEVSLGTVLRIGFIGAFFNTFLLGGLGGDAVKLALLVRETGDGVRATAAVLLDRALALLALLTLGGVSLLLSWPVVAATPGLRQVALVIFPILGVSALCVLVAALLLARGRLDGLRERLAGAEGGPWAAVQRVLSRILEAAVLVRHRLRLMGAMLLVSVGSQICTIFALFTFTRAMGRTLPDLTQLFSVVPVAMVVNAVPVPGGGLGVGETALATLLELFSVDGQPITGGASIFLSWRVWVVLWGLLLGLPTWLLSRGRGRDTLSLDPEKERP